MLIREVIVFKGSTHLVSGIGGGLLLKNVLGPLGIAMAAFGALLPDIDHPDSIIGRKALIARIFNMQHRGWTHSLLGLLIFSVLFAFINIALIPGLVIGYITHLLTDSLTPAGIAWFYPISKNPKHIIGIYTGGFMESIFKWSFLCVLLVLLWYLW